MNSVAEKVRWVEELCDLVEDMNHALLNFYGKPASIPASLAAIRVHFYIGGNSESEEIYKRLHYVLSEEKVHWSDMNIVEQRALLQHIQCHLVFIYP